MAKAKVKVKRLAGKKPVVKKKPAKKARKPAAKRVPAIPMGHHTVTPHLVVQGAARAIEFYKRAFGAVEIARMPPVGEPVMHAELRIGDSIVYLGDEVPQADCRAPTSVGGTTFNMHLYVDDADSVFDRAVRAGATVTMPLEDAFWGDRYGKLKDPFGHSWAVATHKEDLTAEEIGQRAAAIFGGPPG